jgi:hypothetical protein
MELLQVLQRISLLLLLVKAGVFDLIRIAHPLKHNLVLMVLVRYILVVLENRFLGPSSVTPKALYYQQAAFKTLKRKQPGRSP